ncbi:hypothetical protein WN48_01505 [Eufriesea mexicana]|nr:hypothetical protein WN48_01505 [Eufriesea mexicana]
MVEKLSNLGKAYLSASTGIFRQDVTARRDIGKNIGRECTLCYKNRNKRYKLLSTTKARKIAKRTMTICSTCSEHPSLSFASKLCIENTLVPRDIYPVSVIRGFSRSFESPQPSVSVFSIQCKFKSHPYIDAPNLRVLQ